MKILGSILLAVLTFGFAITACSPAVQPTQAISTTPDTSTSSTATNLSQARVGTLRLMGTIGPLSIPLAYMQRNNVLSSVTEHTTLDIWATPGQLQAIIASGQADFISLTSNAAATFYNKGISLALLDISIWNILYLVSSDSSIISLIDLKGKRIVVPYQSALPDAMFRYVLQKQGLNPDGDIDIYYSADPIQALQLLLSGQEKYCLLSEPSATQIILKGQTAGLPLYRNLNMRTEWAKATSSQKSTPIAGTVVMGAMKYQTAIVDTFVKEYRKAVEWMLTNPVEAGKLGASVLSQQGFTAEALTESLQNIDWRFVTARDANPDLEAFYKALAEVSPNYIGGKVPDGALYYGQ
jgi:NitT/TauT family transport system substrate-binding protein